MSLTRITRPLTRVTDSTDHKGNNLVVTLHPRYIELRFLGFRKTYRVAYMSCLNLAVKLARENTALEREMRRRAKRKPKS